MSYAVALCVASTLTGCSDDRPDVDVLGSWLLVSGTTFADGSVGGRAPCNDYGVAYELDGHELDLTADGGVAQTLVGCDGAAGELESAYLDALGGTRTAARDGEVLTLSGDGTELEFRHGTGGAWLVYRR